MLCLSTWSGLTLSKASQTQVLPCYAKLGGKYVGKIRLGTSSSAYQVLQYIQEQASKLLPHAWRGFEDIMAWCDNQWLIPSGFAYKDNLTQEEEEQAWAAIQNTKRLEVMWDDNDEHANKIARADASDVVVENQAAYIGLGSNTILPREVVGLLKRSRVPWLVCQKNQHHEQFGTTSLAFLKRTTFTHMTLIDVLPTDWSDCTNIPEMRVLTFSGRMDLTLGMSCLRNLRDLILEGMEILPQDFGGLNLARFSLTRSNHLELRDLVPHLVKMPNLETLCYLNNYKPNMSIPTELGSLVSLKVLGLRENRFVGTIPSELGRLTNLASLTIIEFYGLDLTCPQEVLDLSIAKLVVKRP